MERARVIGFRLKDGLEIEGCLRGMLAGPVRGLVGRKPYTSQLQVQGY